MTSLKGYVAAAVHLSFGMDTGFTPVYRSFIPSEVKPNPKKMVRKRKRALQRKARKINRR